MDEEKRFMIGSIFWGLVISIGAVSLIVIFIIGAIRDGNNPDSPQNPTSNQQPFTEPNFDNLDPDGLINGSR